jgi:putative ABC transport system permease protein
VSWWSRLLSGERLEKELDAELRFHLERQVEDSIRAGIPEQEARRLAWNQFGGIEQVKEDCRDVRGTRWVDETLRDLGLASRVLARDWPFAAAAIATLALAIGLNAATFSVVEAVLVRPLPFRNPEALVWISERNDDLETISGAHLESWRQGAESLEVLSPILTGDATLEGSSSQVRFACVSAQLTRLFGVAPPIGRDFSDSDFHDAPVAPGLRAGAGPASGVAVLSDRLFRSLGGSGDLLGRPVAIHGVPYDVVGVLPASFSLPTAPSLQLGVGPQAEVDLFLGISVHRSYRGPGAILGRLAPDVSISAATSELRILARNVDSQDARTTSQPAPELRVMPLQERIVAQVRRTILILWACVGLVLLIGCANVGGLLLARLVARRHEMSVRLALGAGRWRLTRQLLAENAVLTLASGVSALALAWACVALLRQVGPVDVPRLREVAVSPGVLLACTTACGLTMLLLSIVPMLRIGGASTVVASDRGVVTGSSNLRRWHGAVVVGQLALTLTLLSGAGLMLRSLMHVQAEGAALAPERVLTARVRAQDLRTPSPPQDRLLRNGRLLEQLEALPGVRRAALWTVTFGYPGRVESLPGPPEPPVAMWFNVSPGFHEASGVRLLAGRWFNDADRDAQPPVVLVSKRFAEMVVPGGARPDALVGRRTLGPFSPPQSDGREGPLSIIGVVSDYRSGQYGILQPDDPQALPQVFYLDTLRPVEGGDLLLRTAAHPGSLVPSVRRAVEERGGLRLIGGADLDDQLSRAIAPRRFHTNVTVTFGLVALLVAVAGISGVLRYSVAQRRREIGVRMVLGARPADIRNMVISQAGRLLAAGVAGGLVGALVLSRSVGAGLYGVGATDPAAHVGATSLLVGIALCAAYLPARHAMLTSPSQSLRRN